MNMKSVEHIEKTIKNTVEKHHIILKDGDVQAFCKAYIRFGDVDLALNTEGEVLSDVMEETHLDIIASALHAEFGKQTHPYPEQTYLVKINGKSYSTHVDEYGDQRFIGNRILEHCLQTACLDYETERTSYETGGYTTDEWVEFNALIGSKLKDFMLTLKTCVEFENSRKQQL